MRNFLFAGILCLCVASTANAGLLTLSSVAPNDPLQQQTNNPCVLGSSDCNSRVTPEINAFTPTPTGGGLVDWDLTSPGYSVGVIRLLFGNNFRVGLDFSQAQGQPDQILGLFAMTVNGNVIDVFTGPVAVPPTAGGNAGNGFADYVLTGFNISAFNPGDTVRFHAIMFGANDGPDQAFLIRQQDVVPEPTSLIMWGLGLIGVARRFLR